MIIIYILSVVISLIVCQHKFEVKGDNFLMDGKPFVIKSGSMHYFRHHPLYWEDRILKLKAMGLNTISTYVAWNLHNPEKTQYTFDGMADIELFLKLTIKHNMFVLLRPGPYICGEWELGGIPYWILQNKDIKIRTYDQVWMNEISTWYSVFMTKMKPYLFSNGGNIIFVQVENEYGFYACDHKYMGWLYNETVKYTGNDIVIYTTDTYSTDALTCGSTPGAYAAVDFGVRDAVDPFNVQRQFQKEGPNMNSEFYPGWLSHWGGKYPQVGTDGVVNTMKQMLDMGASFNFYMAIGGTNFGFYAGSNGGGNDIEADTTSYDYDAPLSEAGDCTFKCGKIREALQKYSQEPLIDMPANVTKYGYGDIIFTKSSLLWNNIDILTQYKYSNNDPLYYEDMKLAYGYALYTTKLYGDNEKNIKINEIRDIAIIYINKILVKKLFRKDSGKTFNLGSIKGELEILVENMGRINFGGGMTDRKGLNDITINGNKVYDWLIYTLPMNDISKIKYDNTLYENGPTFYFGTFNINKDNVHDTFIDVTGGWIKGQIYINGYNIGRYWEPGPPQHALYVPAPLLKEGVNEVVVFEQDKGIKKMKSIDHPLLEY